MRKVLKMVSSAVFPSVDPAELKAYPTWTCSTDPAPYEAYTIGTPSTDPALCEPPASEFPPWALPLWHPPMFSWSALVEFVTITGRQSDTDQPAPILASTHPSVSLGDVQSPTVRAEVPSHLPLQFSLGDRRCPQHAPARGSLPRVLLLSQLLLHHSCSLLNPSQGLSQTSAHSRQTCTQQKDHIRRGCF